MNSRTTIKILTVVCFAELAVIICLVWQGAVATEGPVQAELPVAQRRQETPARPPVVAPSVERDVAPPDLVQRTHALETELAGVKKELDDRKSEIAFSYGSVRDSGRFVGMTFRKMFETAAARESKEAQERMADNQINVLSLGPFIQDAEVIESDPLVFAQFQTPLISEVLGLPAQRSAEVEAMLGDLKAKSLKLEAGSPEWVELNDTALQKITALLSDDQKQAMKGQINFFQQYGVLVIPAYSLLKSPAPTVASPTGLGR